MGRVPGLSIIGAAPKLSRGKPSDASTCAVSERIAAWVTVLRFRSQYIDLKPTAGGALGLCPSHDDHRRALGSIMTKPTGTVMPVAAGKSVIGLCIMWHKCGFRRAVIELAGMAL